MELDRRQMLGATLALTTVGLGGAARAQAFPSKPVRCIVPYPPGGNVDVTARLIAEPMTKSLGQSVVIENRAGGGGLVGADATLALPADGHTFVIGALGTVYVAAIMIGKEPPLQKLTPVSLLTSVPMVIVAPPNGRFADWPSVMKHIRGKPGDISVGHAGNGTPNHIDILRIQLAEKVNFNIVPYRGSGQGLNDVLAGQIDLYVDQLSSSLPHIRSGKLRPLVVLSPQRVPEVKDTPTLADLGGPNFDGGTTLGVFVRAETPKPAIATLNSAIVGALNDPNVKARLTDLGATIMPSTPEAFATWLDEEVKQVASLSQMGLLKE
jgi:tripartite-type tricarboxylate transporter receptor subunit TctC